MRAAVLKLPGSRAGGLVFALVTFVSGSMSEGGSMNEVEDTGGGTRLRPTEWFQLQPNLI
jgi:hypothetical protein